MSPSSRPMCSHYYRNGHDATSCFMWVSSPNGGPIQAPQVEPPMQQAASDEEGEQAALEQHTARRVPDKVHFWNKSIQLKDFISKTTHIQTHTIQFGEISWRQQGGEGQLSHQQYQQNKQSSITAPPGFQSQSPCNPFNGPPVIGPFPSDQPSLKPIPLRSPVNHSSKLGPISHRPSSADPLPCGLMLSSPPNASSDASSGGSPPIPGPTLPRTPIPGPAPFGSPSSGPAAAAPGHLILQPLLACKLVKRRATCISPSPPCLLPHLVLEKVHVLKLFRHDSKILTAILSGRLLYPVLLLHLPPRTSQVSPIIRYYTV
ncbi:hypothetical protein M9H77_22400 [Catharanthus roseus]|uniref:Uncharacterized protein n=1 Tax=Catharanthus roseus TaxID=4058 RepID=A0ACC0ASX1_CATRO|nr:hypothetical protein M9H77_22400 [Catharanthus roseus]